MEDKWLGHTALLFIVAGVAAFVMAEKTGGNTTIAIIYLAGGSLCLALGFIFAVGAAGPPPPE